MGSEVNSCDANDSCKGWGAGTGSLQALKIMPTRIPTAKARRISIIVLFEVFTVLTMGGRWIKGSIAEREEKPRYGGTHKIREGSSENRLEAHPGNVRAAAWSDPAQTAEENRDGGEVCETA